MNIIFESLYHSLSKTVFISNVPTQIFKGPFKNGRKSLEPTLKYYRKNNLIVILALSEKSLPDNALTIYQIYPGNLPSGNANMSAMLFSLYRSAIINR